MIARIWHGWTTPANADAYERLLKSTIFPAIAAKSVLGYRGIRLLRRSLPSREVEFFTLMTLRASRRAVLLTQCIRPGAQVTPARERRS